MDTRVRAALAVTALAVLALPGPAAATAVAGPTPYANYVGGASDTASDGDFDHLDPQQQRVAAVDGQSEHLVPRGHLDPGQI